MKYLRINLKTTGLSVNFRPVVLRHLKDDRKIVCKDKSYDFRKCSVNWPVVIRLSLSIRKPLKTVVRSSHISMSGTV